MPSISITSSFAKLLPSKVDTLHNRIFRFLVIRFGDGEYFRLPVGDTYSIFIVGRKLAVGSHRGLFVLQDINLISACIDHGLNGQGHTGKQSGATTGGTEVRYFRFFVQLRAHAVTYEGTHN